MEWLKQETSNFMHWLSKWTISLQIDKFWEIIDNILEMVQDRDIVTVED